MSVTVATLYGFAALPDAAGYAEMLGKLARANGIRGTLLLAKEGINGTIAGSATGVAAVIDAIRTISGLENLEIKYSDAATMPFYRLKVRVKPEIVTMGLLDLDLDTRGIAVAAADWNALVDDPDTILIDTRNDYEVAVGSFTGAINPQTPSFRDFPAWFDANCAEISGKKVAMFCTGGIRCEKATAFLKAQGIADVFHLRGGILKYLEVVPAHDSRWRGECFVFDERVSLGHGLQPGTHALCRGCRIPVSAADRKLPAYVDGVACPACAATRNTAQRAGAAERHRQEALAAERGALHIGYTDG